MHKVTFLPGGQSVWVKNGTTLLAAEIAAGLVPDAPCGGMGTCGKCRLELGGADGARESVLACRTAVDRDLTVRLPEGAQGLRILQDGQRRAVMAAPAVATARLQSGAEAVLYDGELLDVRPAGEEIYHIAVDIGTTTVVVYLLAGSTGETVAVESELNPQTAFGADVIGRLSYAMEHGAQPLTEAIRGAVNRLAARAAARAGMCTEDIFSATVVGNTCMHHFFLGLPTEGLAHAPFTPASCAPLAAKAGDYGLALHPAARLFVLPCLAGFVGADTSALMLACAFDEREELTLAVDIGTNGEMVLGDRRRRVACSTAAGPAFEGARISCGMRGAEGAIDHVSVENGALRLSVIGDTAPAGLCGSGLLDAAAALLRLGILDESGRLRDSEELCGGARELARRQLGTAEGIKAFYFCRESEGQRPVYLTQKDIRELQLAKAAVAAGIRMLLRRLGRDVSEIREVCLAGAFGSYLSPESACRTGLVPPELAGRMAAVGNAAGIGAAMAAVNAGEFARAARLAEDTTLVELAGEAAFQEIFVDELAFPEAEEET